MTLAVSKTLVGVWEWRLKIRKTRWGRGIRQRSWRKGERQTGAKQMKQGKMGRERSGRWGEWERDNGESSTRENMGWAYIKQLHLKYTCQRAVIVKAAPAVHCTLPDPRPVKYAMLDQKGVFLCPAPDPRSVKTLPSQITGPQITWVERLCQCWFTLWMLFHCVYMIPRSVKALQPFR